MMPGPGAADAAPFRRSPIHVPRPSRPTMRSSTIIAGLTLCVSIVDSVSVRDSLTAVVWFKKRTPSEFFDFVYQIAIMPEHVYGRIPRDELTKSDVLRKPVGSGRFRLVRWDAGQRIELIADTANYRGRPPLDRV